MTSELAAEVGRVRWTVANRVNAVLLARHPDWIRGHGDRARADVAQEARHLIEAIQVSVELNDPATFRDHALWCRDLLISRGISVRFLLENLEAIRDEMASRLSAPAAEAVNRAARAGLESLAAGHGSPWATGEPLSPECRRYLAASVSGRREDALAIVREAVSGAESPVDAYIDILQSALYEVGRGWQTTRLTVAEEHMATATTQFILSVLHAEHPRTARHGGAAVVTGVPNEQHVVGASIVANVLDADGWDVRFVGTDLPQDAIVAAIGRAGASLVAISVTMSSSVAEARALIGQVRRNSAIPPRIIVGGAAFLRDPKMWRIVGADGFASDARSVAALARG